MVSLFLYQNIYSKLNFLMDKPLGFISWICPLMKTEVKNEGQYIFHDGDELTCIFFLISGEAGFVLPQYNNLAYISISEGCHFGIIDIFASLLNIFPGIMEMSPEELKETT